MQTNEICSSKMLSKNYAFTNPISLIHMDKEELALDNLQKLICLKTNQTNHQNTS